MFHQRDGLYFQNLGDGAVRIVKTSDGKAIDEDNVILDHIIPPNEWASVIASVSALGESNGRWELAKEFHGIAVSRVREAQPERRSCQRLSSSCPLCGRPSPNHDGICPYYRALPLAAQPEGK